jgi:hypothetical protein
VFAVGSLEFSWALDGYGGHTANEGVQKLMENAMGALTSPPAPRSLSASARGTLVTLRAPRRAPDPRLRRLLVYRHAGPDQFAVRGADSVLVCSTTRDSCREREAPGVYRYAAVHTDRWGRSSAVYSRALSVTRGTKGRRRSR